MNPSLIRLVEPPSRPSPISLKYDTSTGVFTGTVVTSTCPNDQVSRCVPADQIVADVVSYMWSHVVRACGPCLHGQSVWSVPVVCLVLEAFRVSDEIRHVIPCRCLI